MSLSSVFALSNALRLKHFRGIGGRPVPTGARTCASDPASEKASGGRPVYCANWLLLATFAAGFLTASHPASGQTWWEYQSRDDAVWTEVTDTTGVLWLVKGVNDVNGPDARRLVSCQDPRLPLETEWVLRTEKITFANESYPAAKPCGQDTIGWLVVSEADVSPAYRLGYMPRALHFGDAGFIKCGYNAFLCVDVHVVATREELPTPLPPWRPATSTSPTTPTPPATPPATPTALTVTLSASPNPVAEGDAVTITVTPSQLLASDATVPLVLTSGTAEAEDYSALASIVIEANEPDGTGVIATTVDDDLDDETFTVALGTLPSGLATGVQASVEVTITDDAGATSIASLGSEMPTAFALEQNYPNPFNPETTIRYALPRAGMVRLAVYDLLGREVAALVDELQPAGRHAARFHADDLQSGVYAYRLHTGDKEVVRTMVLVK